VKRIEELIRGELEARPRPKLSPFFARRTAHQLRSQPAVRPLAGLIVTLLIVPPSIWILATSLSPFSALLLLPLGFAITMMANPIRS
jgi:hypothetical protein